MLLLPPIPNPIKHITHYLKVADAHDEHNIVISYWSRMWACLVALRSVEGLGASKPPEVRNVIVALMDWLNTAKVSYANEDGITNLTAASAILEKYILELLTFAEAQDQTATFTKNVIRAYFTCGVLMDVLGQFGPLNQDMSAKKSYVIWKASYIHNCLKAGQKPTPGLTQGPSESNNESDEDQLLLMLSQITI